MLSAYRKNDAIIVVCQDNQARRIEIAGMNDRAEQLLGKSKEALTGQSLVDHVPPKLAETIADYVDFTPNGKDLGDVLSKVHSLDIADETGAMYEYRLRVVRSEAVDRKPVFHILLQNDQEHRENEAFKQVLHENFKGHESIETHTGLPDRESLVKDLELLQHHQEKKREFGAAFAVIRVDGIDLVRLTKSPEAAYEILTHVGRLCRQRLRKDDQVGVLSAATLGLILMDISPEATRIVLSRLRLTIGAMPMIMQSGERADITVSIAFQMVKDRRAEQMIAICEEKLRTMGDGGVASILEIV